MLNECALVAFISSSDLGRSRDFFSQTIGLSIVEENPFACVFDANGTTLRVTAVSEVRRAPYTVLGWIVPDIAVAVRGLTERGVDFERFDGMIQDELGAWTTPGGDMVAWFKDPDGNLLSLTQPATVVA